jgi:protease I
MAGQLGGMQVAILVTDNFEQIEMTGPRAALENAGARTTLLSEKRGMVQSVHQDRRAEQFVVDRTFDEANPQEFDGVLLPGGVWNADRLRKIPAAQRFVKSMDGAAKPIAVICHASWLLVSSRLVRDRTLTSWPTIEDDIRNAGGNWVDKEAVVDGNWVSSRMPEDIPAFNFRMLELFAAHRSGRQVGQAHQPGAEHATAVPR